MKIICFVFLAQIFCFFGFSQSRLDSLERVKLEEDFFRACARGTVKTIDSLLSLGVKIESEGCVLNNSAGAKLNRFFSKIIAGPYSGNYDSYTCLNALDYAYKYRNQKVYDFLEKKGLVSSDLLSHYLLNRKYEKAFLMLQNDTLGRCKESLIKYAVTSFKIKNLRAIDWMTENNIKVAFDKGFEFSELVSDLIENNEAELLSILLEKFYTDGVFIFMSGKYNQAIRSNNAAILSNLIEFAETHKKWNVCREDFEFAVQNGASIDVLKVLRKEFLDLSNMNNVLEQDVSDEIRSFLLNNGAIPYDEKVVGDSLGYLLTWKPGARGMLDFDSIAQAKIKIILKDRDCSRLDEDFLDLTRFDILEKAISTSDLEYIEWLLKNSNARLYGPKEFEFGLFEKYLTRHSKKQVKFLVQVIQLENDLDKRNTLVDHCLKYLKEHEPFKYKKRNLKIFEKELYKAGLK